MAALHDIKKARELGKKLRIAREMQEHSLPLLANQCGMSIIQLIALESGHYFMFNASIEEYCINARNYAFVLHADLDCLIEEENLFSSSDQYQVDPIVPSFLRKKNHAI